MGRIRNYFSRRKKRWEALCHHCGLCCYEKGLKKGRYYIDLTRACKFLDVETNGCLVYDQRFSVCKDCSKLGMYHALFAIYLPKSCGYVQKYRFWKKLQRKILFRDSLKNN